MSNILQNHLLNILRDYIINEKKLIKKTDELLKQLEIKIETQQYVSELTLFEKTVIELIKHRDRYRDSVIFLFIYMII